MALKQGTRNYLVRKWFHEELGRIPKGDEQALHTIEMAKNGDDLDKAFTGIYDSTEAKGYRRRVKRDV